MSGKTNSNYEEKISQIEHKDDWASTFRTIQSLNKLDIVVSVFVQRCNKQRRLEFFITSDVDWIRRFW